MIRKLGHATGHAKEFYSSLSRRIVCLAKQPNPDSGTLGRHCLFTSAAKASACALMCFRSQDLGSTLPLLDLVEIINVQSN